MSLTITISSWPASKVTAKWASGQSLMPLKISSYMAATRSGVRSRPSRSGFSPMASRISRTAFSMRPRSTPSPFPSGVTRGAGWAAAGEHLAVLVAKLLGPDEIAHAVFGDHRAGDLAGALDVVLGAGRRVVEDQLLGRAPAEQHGELVA